MNEAGAGAGHGARAAARPAVPRLDPAVVHGVGSWLPRVHPGRRPLSGGARGLHRRTPRTATPASGRPRRRSCSSKPTRSTGCATGWGFRRDRAGCSRPAARWPRSTPSSARANGTSAPRSGAACCTRPIRRTTRCSSPRSSPASCRIACARSSSDDRVPAPHRRAARSRSPTDRRAGLTPFAVVSSAGTTNTGAVDPLDAIADLCATEQLWHHVDGAYGAFFHLCDELRAARCAACPRADSLTLDPHKGMFLPYGTGALLVRDGAALRAAHEAHRGLPAGDAASRGVLRSEPARSRAVARVSGPARLAVGEAVRRRRVSGGARREARADARRRAPGRRAAGHRDRRGARAVAVRLPPHAGPARRGPTKTRRRGR